MVFKLNMSFGWFSIPKKAGNSAGAMGREKQKLKLSGKLHKEKTEMSSILQNLTECIK